MRHFIQCVAFVVLILACLSGCRKTEQDMQVMNTEANEISVPSDASVVETEPYLTTVPNEVKTQHLFQEVAPSSSKPNAFRMRSWLMFRRFPLFSPDVFTPSAGNGPALRRNAMAL